jgi:hypothetical protein
VEVHNGIAHLRDVFHKLNRIIFIFLYILGSSVNWSLCFGCLTCTLINKEQIVFKITCINGGPNASLSSVRGGMMASREAVRPFIQISVELDWWGIWEA